MQSQILPHNPIDLGLFLLLSFEEDSPFPHEDLKGVNGEGDLHFLGQGQLFEEFSTFENMFREDRNE